MTPLLQLLDAAAPVVTPVIVVAAFLWLRSDVRRIEGKVDRLADDHNALARELSEVKGFLQASRTDSAPGVTP